MRKHFPVLDKLVGIISRKNPLQKKALKSYLEDCDRDFLTKTEWYLSNYVAFLSKASVDLAYIADSYLMMVKDILVEQTKFLRTGRYSHDNLNDVYQKVYSNKEYMFRYMIGVALSQFLWKNHREMFLFFKRHVREAVGGSYLEIGPGHGLYFMEAVNTELFEHIRGIDISETSLEITKDFLAHTIGIKTTDIRFDLGDICDHMTEEKYDFVTMGEVLEHVEQPKRLLAAISDLLKDNGQAYISTCANSPVIDHIYLYKSIDEIRADFTESGLEIVEEIIICNDNTEESNWISEKANLSYACISQKSVT